MTISVAEAKARLSAILQAAEAGEEVLITRRGKPVVRLTAVAKQLKPMDFGPAEELRARQKPGAEPSARWLRRLREESRC
ncbi:MAG TPA: type II toxin-antitoxin system prevent-host-death family antitoxin [Terriglobales bacterium]|jgi:prevent-host-death family protein